MSRYLCVIIVGQIVASPLAAQDADYSRLKLAHTLAGHDTAITAIAVSPDSRTLAAASYDDAVTLWDLTTGKMNGALRGHESTIRSLRFSPDGSLLASGSNDKTIRLWDVVARREKANWTSPSETRTLMFSPKGNILASASHDKTITLRNLHSGIANTIETGHRTWVREILFSPNGKTLASNGYYDVKVWDTTGKEVRTIKGRASTMMFSPDGKTLMSAISHRLSKWTVAEKGDPRVFEGQEYASYKRLRAILSPDGKSLASIDQDLAGVNLGRGLVPFGMKRCRLIIMDVKGGTERTIVENRGTTNWFGTLSYSPNGRTLALWNRNDESITLVDADNGNQQARLTSPDGKRFRPGRVPPMTFTPNGKTVITTHGPSIALWMVP